MFLKIVLLGACAFGYYTLSRTLERIIEEIGEKKHTDRVRIKYIVRTLNIALFFAFVLMTPFIMGIGFGEISVFLSSLFAIIGVALFAQWSILSNMTASLIIFFSFPYRVGDRIRVIDKDDDISGIIEEVTLFHVLIRRDNLEIIAYPNSLILQKAVLKQRSAPAQDIKPAVLEGPTNHEP